MGMMDLYTEERVTEALADSIKAKEALLKEIEKIDAMIFILKYYLATGDPLDAAAFDIEDLEGDLIND